MNLVQLFIGIYKKNIEKQSAYKFHRKIDYPILIHTEAV
ncbi:MAG: hypothetical protein Terrestrivirus1_113 [Terrestrivirus sp.]|uniref:Uncharacterized protein n=1 Tax=Terrestrivirus sp. TaxID=2487775 RepID=A0A3G4ZP51_9VIRU|nr:MAG: hypothetical protein Terrestrivirus1_113 [Terrestrivirus sp.]